MSAQLHQRRALLKEEIAVRQAELAAVERALAQAACPFAVDDVIIHSEHPKMRFLVLQVEASVIGEWELRVARFKNNGYPAQRSQRLFMGLNRLSKVGTWSRP